MKKCLMMLLVAASAAYAADNALGLSDDTLALGDKIIVEALECALKKTSEPLTGTISEFYLCLHQEGYKTFMERNPVVVSKAEEYVALLTDKNSADEKVQAAVAAFECAQTAGQDADISKRIEVWGIELKAYSIALIRLIQKNTPADLVIHPSSTERIIRNNRKAFESEAIVAFSAGSLAVLAGFERRRRAMGEETFKVFCDDQLFDSPAHHVICSIAPEVAK